MKKLSIVIPVYNVEKYLKRCMDSILIQNSNDIEIILVDDGSTDKSWEICKEYQRKFENIYIFQKENGGASSARNYGIKKATGEYVWFIDSDDSIDKSIIVITELLNKYSPDVFVCQSKVVTMAGETKDECVYSIKRGLYSSSEFMDTLKKNPKSVIFCPQYYIVKRKFMEKNKIYFYEGIIYEDELWIPQLLIKAQSIFYSELNVYYHYMVSTSVMHSTKLEKCGISALTVSNELFKIYEISNRKDLEFLRDRNVNIFLQAVWKKNNFLKDKENVKRTLPIKNAFYFRTKLKSILYLLSPKLYISIHNIIKK